MVAKIPLMINAFPDLSSHYIQKDSSSSVCCYSLPFSSIDVYNKSQLTDKRHINNWSESLET